jgi:hypothetical protein
LLSFEVGKLTLPGFWASEVCSAPKGVKWGLVELEPNGSPLYHAFLSFVTVVVQNVSLKPAH